MNHNYKTVIEFGFGIINEELWRSLRVLSVEAVTPSSISIILHKVLSLIY